MLRMGDWGECKGFESLWFPYGTEHLLDGREIAFKTVFAAQDGTPNEEKFESGLLHQPRVCEYRSLRVVHYYFL